MTAPPTKAPDSKFRRGKCADCGGEQILYTRAATRVPCAVCGAALAEPTGGLAIIKGEILGVVE
jgi:small subunit ribosomal protein S27e